VQNYAWDKRIKDDVRKCFEEGKVNGLIAIQAIKNYCLTKSLSVEMNCGALIDFIDNSKNEKFEEDGKLAKYEYDFLLRIAYGKQIYTYQAEMKTTPAILSCDIWIKKAQIDNLIQEYQNPIVIVSDPLKFMMMDAKKFRYNSKIQNEDNLGGKAVYLYPFEKILWSEYQSRLEFIQLRNKEVF
jgi:hypothetical protein